LCSGASCISRRVVCNNLSYADFETEPHPALCRCVRLWLRTRQLNCYDHTDSANPPVLHRKEAFLQPVHALYEKFAWLTRQGSSAACLPTRHPSAPGPAGRSAYVRRGLPSAGTGLCGGRETLPRSGDTQRTMIEPSSNPSRLVRQVNEFAS
jgi:hypothetical protein